MQERNLATIAARLSISLTQPLTERDLCNICIVFIFDGRKITTLGTFLSAVSHWHLHKFGTELPRGWKFRSTKAGLENIFALDNVSDHAPGITLEHLRAIRRLIDSIPITGPSQRFARARDWCAILFAFFGLLRINEYANGGLKQRHVIAFQHCIQLNLPFSKTSPTPVDVVLSARPDILCPLAAYRAYTSLLGASRSAPSLPFFVVASGSQIPMNDRMFIVQVRQWLSFIGVAGPGDFTGHSFRRGGFTALCQHGVPIMIAQAHGRWRSLSYQRYLDTANSPEVRLRATAQLSDRTSHFVAPS